MASPRKYGRLREIIMKLSKKVLAALSTAALLATAGVFVSCAEDDDDPENAITGSGSNYEINYANSSKTDIYRAYKTTTFKHEGELVKITLNNQETTTHNGAMGFIWDLCKSKDAAPVTSGTETITPVATDENLKNFFVVGFRNNSTAPQMYISKFFNVSDLQADNFGAKTTVTTHQAGITATEPKELEVVKAWNVADLSDIDIASDKTLTFWVDIYPVFENSKYGVNYAAHANLAAGSYVVEVYAADPTGDTPGDPVFVKTIATNITGYTAEPTQHTLAVYANVQPEKTLSGSWNLAKDYAADEVVEE